MSLLRRLLHIHSPSLAWQGRDPAVTRRRAKSCAICAAAFAPPPTPQEAWAAVMRAGARQHALMCDDDYPHHQERTP